MAANLLDYLVVSKGEKTFGFEFKLVASLRFVMGEAALAINYKGTAIVLVNVTWLIGNQLFVMLCGTDQKKKERSD
jgi:hypothetical protein